MLARCGYLEITGNLLGTVDDHCAIFD